MQDHGRQVAAAQLIEAADVLERAAARIERPGAWLRGALAGYGGRGVGDLEPTDPAADCWCADGAIEAEAALLYPAEQGADRAALKLRAAAVLMSTVDPGAGGAWIQRVWDWNDGFGVPTAGADYIAPTMRRAAASARARAAELAEVQP